MARFFHSAVAFLLCALVVSSPGRQRSAPSAPPASTPLEETLSWIGERLKKEGTLAFTSGTSRYDYWKADGCRVAFRVTETQAGSPFGTSRVLNATEETTFEWTRTFDLRDLDATQVQVAKRSASWGVAFASANPQAIGNVYRTRRGGEWQTQRSAAPSDVLVVSSRRTAEGIATALRQAIGRCQPGVGATD